MSVLGFELLPRNFIVDLVKMILANWQIHTLQYVQFAQYAMAHYQNTNGLSLKSINESSTEIEGENN
jgi:hypothetical protein